MGKMELLTISVNQGIQQIDPLVPDDLKCLKPGIPLNNRVINAVLSLLEALGPFTVTTATSFLNDTSTALMYDQALGAPPCNPSTLVPIHISPSDAHEKFVQKRITSFDQQSLRPTYLFVEQSEYPYQDKDSMDSGVAMLRSAIYTVAASLGSKVVIPERWDAVRWRDILALLLETSMGQARSLSWATQFSSDTALLETDMLPLSSSSVSYWKTLDMIATREQLIGQQLAQLDEKRHMIAQETNNIIIVLDSLLGGLVRRLELETARCKDDLELLTNFRGSINVSILQRKEQILHQELIKCQHHMGTCCQDWGKTVIALGGCLRELGKVTEALEGR
ncbi:hypothetical protein F4778DRAFT_528909 [Xylariomycetidae sp. FL2044]|nr:hypothetical protein F4778DRAFT_528909 [Xylariomycetidae sp. FL2044]